MGNTQQLVKIGNFSNYDITNWILVQKYKISHLFFGSMQIRSGHNEDRGCPSKWSGFAHFFNSDITNDILVQKYEITLRFICLFLFGTV